MRLKVNAISMLLCMGKLFGDVMGNALRVDEESAIDDENGCDVGILAVTKRCGDVVGEVLDRKDCTLELITLDPNILKLLGKRRRNGVECGTQILDLAFEAGGMEPLPEM